MSRTPPRCSLATLLTGAGRDDLPVAFGGARPRSLRDLRRDVARLAVRLEPLGAGEVLIHSRNAYAVAVGLLAVAETGGAARLCPGPEPERLQALARGVGAALVDSALLAPGASELCGVPALDPLAMVAGPERDLGALARDAPFVSFHTSGTTGAPRLVAKKLAHLDDEIRALESRFGPLLPAAAPVFATVPPHHIYGLLFRVLWPLAAGRPFEESAPLQPEELSPRMAAHPASLLVTTPVHLAHLVRHAGGELLRPLRDRCRAVFCSGGPLPAEVAKAVTEQLGFAPFEVLGSTETGGVAVRQRSLDGESFAPLPEVQVECDAEGALVVTSPFVSTGVPVSGGRRRVTTGDRIRMLEPGRFLHLGRGDRVVKVGEKRLSLPEMEAALCEHPAVAEAALVLAPRGGGLRVHAALALSAEGHRRLAGAPRRALSDSLHRHLARRFDRVLLPRAFRYLEALPRNAQGKLPEAELRALFQAKPDERVRPRTATVCAERRGPGRIERELVIPGDLAQLEGHFPGCPVVPGVAQLRFAFDAAAVLLGAEPRVASLAALKFPSLLRPGERCRLLVELTVARDGLSFCLSSPTGDRVFASGRARLSLSPELP